MQVGQNHEQTGGRTNWRMNGQIDQLTKISLFGKIQGGRKDTRREISLFWLFSNLTSVLYMYTGNLPGA